jgi:hypothetical protein
MTQQIKWAAITPAAKTLFNIWTEQSDLAWAEKAWHILAEQGLTTYNNDLEKQLVIIRLYALAQMYGGFCQAAVEQSCDIDDLVYDFKAQLEETECYLSLFRLGQLLGPTEFLEETLVSSECESDILPQLLTTIANTQTNIIYKALFSGFESDNALFISLWNSCQSPEQAIEHPDQFSFLTGGPGYYFVEQGMVR